MCSCSEAFHTLQACAILVVGVAGSMPAHGIGTACFIATQGDKEFVVKVHNCLLCHGEDSYNLISVSQVLRTRMSAIVFSADQSKLEVGDGGESTIPFSLQENEGLYEWRVSPLYLGDDRIRTLSSLAITLEADPRL